MIDQTSNRIEEREMEVRRANRRRYAFHRMLQATDRVLWRLEELNRDGVKVVPKRVRQEIRALASSLAGEMGETLGEAGKVQDALDGTFEVQEQLFRWRFPGWRDWDPDPEAEAEAS